MWEQEVTEQTENQPSVFLLFKIYPWSVTTRSCLQRPSTLFCRREKAEVHLPDTLYREVETLAKRLHLSVADVLRRAVEQIVARSDGTIREA